MGLNRSQRARLAFLTSPAPNAGAVLERDSSRGGDVRGALRTRVRKVLATAAVHGHDAVILGAWGCGVFRNDPGDVAGEFQAALHGEFAGVFKAAWFAVLDHSDGRGVIAPFERAFGTAPG